MSRIEQLIGEIEAYIDECKVQPFTNNKKIIVEKDVIDDLLVELRARTPGEIERYQKIISNKEAILNNAKQKADEMVNSATQQTKDLISEHEIMRRAEVQAHAMIAQAEVRAQEIVDNAANEANAMRTGAVRYTDEILKSLQTIISHSMENSQARFNAYMTSMQSSYDIVMANRKELSGAEEEEPSVSEEEE